LTGDQHTDHISKGQRVSRDSLPTLLYFLFFPTALFFNSIFASRTFGTFGFARHKKPTLRKTKRAKSPTAQGTECNDKNKLKISYFDNLNLTDI
jgi:hypothetical protein